MDNVVACEAGQDALARNYYGYGSQGAADVSYVSGACKHHHGSAPYLVIKLTLTHVAYSCCSQHFALSKPEQETASMMFKATTGQASSTLC